MGSSPVSSDDLVLFFLFFYVKLGSLMLCSSIKFNSYKYSKLKKLLLLKKNQKKLINNSYGIFVKLNNIKGYEKLTLDKKFNTSSFYINKNIAAKLFNLPLYDCYYYGFNFNNFAQIN